MQGKLRVLFEQHWNAFQQDANALYATPDQRQIQEAIEARIRRINDLAELQLAVIR